MSNQLTAALRAVARGTAVLALATAATLGLAGAAQAAAAAQFTEGTVPTMAPGVAGPVPMSLTQAGSSTAVPNGTGDVITFTAPPNTTISIPTDPGCPGGFTGPTAVTSGSVYTCTARTTSPWPVSQPISLTPNAGTPPGTYTGGSVTLTSAGGTVLATLPITYNVSAPLIAQTSVPTFSAGSTGNTVPMTMTQADGSTSVNAAAGDFITVTAPPNTKVTAFTCGAGTTQTFAANGSSGVCTSNSAGVWTYTSRPITLSVNSGTPAGTYTGTMTYSNKAGTVLASSPVTIIVPGIHIVKTSNPPSPGTVSSGQTITYTLTVTNPGSSPITGANVTDNLTNVIASTSNPTGITASAGTATFTSPKLTWNGTVPANDVPVTITYQVTVK